MWHEVTAPYIAHCTASGTQKHKNQANKFGGELAIYNNASILSSICYLG
jgi:hypothetical protein